MMVVNEIPEKQIEGGMQIGGELRKQLEKKAIRKMSKEEYKLFHNLLVCSKPLGGKTPLIPKKKATQRSRAYHCKMINPNKPSHLWDQFILKRTTYRQFQIYDKKNKQIYNDEESKSIDQIQTDFHALTLLSKSHRVINLQTIINQQKKDPKDAEFFNGFLGVPPQKQLRNVLFILEKCDGGSLEDKVEKCPEYFTEDKILECVCQIVEGLNHLAQKGILHRDLRPCNILFHKQELKFSDFDSAFICGYSTQKDIRNGLELKVNTPPELLEIVSTPMEKLAELSSEELYRFQSKCDIYYLGVNIYKMVFGRDYNDNEEDDCILQSLINQQIINKSNVAMLCVMRQCLKETSQRISLDKLNQWLISVERDRYYRLDFERERCYLIEQPVSRASRRVHMSIKDPFSHPVTQNEQELSFCFKQAFSRATSDRLTHRYVTILQSKFSSRLPLKQLFEETSHHAAVRQSRSKLSQITDGFIRKFTVRASYYQIIFKLTLDVHLEQISGGRRPTVRTCLEEITMSLVLMLQFLFRQVTKYSFKSDLNYFEGEYSYEVRKLFRQISDLHCYKNFFIGRRKAFGLDDLETSKISGLIREYTGFHYEEDEQHSFAAELHQFDVVVEKLDGLLNEKINTFVMNLLEVQERSVARVALMLMMLAVQDVSSLSKKDLAIIDSLFTNIITNKLTFQPDQLAILFKEYQCKSVGVKEGVSEREEDRRTTTTDKVSHHGNEKEKEEEKENWDGGKQISNLEKGDQSSMNIFGSISGVMMGLAEVGVVQGCG